jgi:hypothetical protein
MSRETKQARAVALGAGTRWYSHKADCPRCARCAHSGGRGPGPCKHGHPLYLAYMSAQADLTRNLQLDKHPPAGMDPLF